MSLEDDFRMCLVGSSLITSSYDPMGVFGTFD